MSKISFRIEIRVSSCTIYKSKLKEDLSGIPVVKNLPCNAEDMGLVPGRRTKVPHATKKLSPGTATTQTACLPAWSGTKAEEGQGNQLWDLIARPEEIQGGKEMRGVTTQNSSWG